MTRAPFINNNARKKEVKKIESEIQYTKKASPFHEIKKKRYPKLSKLN
jgi:hypothetical protein